MRWRTDKAATKGNGRSPGEGDAGAAPPDLLRHLTEAVMVVDAAGTITYASEGTERLLGWPSTELTGLPVLTIVPERLRPSHRAAFTRYAAGGEGRILGRPIRLPALCRDGSEAEVELLLSPGGTRDLVIGTMRDGRDRVDLEAHRAVTEQLVQVLAEMADEERAAPRVLQAIAEGLGWAAAGLWTVDRSAKRLRCDTFWIAPGLGLERFRTVSEGSLLPVGVGLPGRVWETGEPAWVIRLAEDRNFPRGAVAAAVGLETGFAFPVGEGGSFLGVVELFDRNVRSHDRNLVEAMLGVGELVGQLLERSRHAEERTRLLGRLQRERARLEAVQRWMPAAVLVADAPSGRVVAGNDMLEALVGPPVVGSDDGEQVLDYPFRHPDGRPYEPHELPFVRAARTGAMTEDAELVLLSPDGEVRHVTVSAAPVRDPHGRVISSVATFHDVTERRRAEDRHRFLSEASAALAHTLDHEAALAEVTQLAIGVLGDSVGAYLLDTDGHMHEAAVAHADPHTAELSEQVRERYGYDESAREGVARVLRTGSTVVYDTIEADLLAEVAKDEEHLALLRELPNRSAMLIPVTSGRAVIGVLTFFSARPIQIFDADTVALAEELGRRVGTAVANARLYERERDLAATLQASLLPQELPQPDWLELAARFQAGGEGLEVGGDSYDAFTAGEDAMALVVGDVCGKGAEAAARTAQFRYTTRALSGSGRDPAAVLDLVDAKVRENDQRGDRFCTAVYALVQPVEDGIHCVASSAGHPLPLVVRADGGVEELPCAGTLLFVLDQPSHRNASTTLHRGDALVLFTDGVTESRGERGMFGVDRLRAVLENAAGSTAEDIADAVARAAAAFSESGAADDIAVLVARCP